jgi:hypothetical protein
VLIALVRVCGGAARVTCGSTRNRGRILACSLRRAPGGASVAQRPYDRERPRRKTRGVDDESLWRVGGRRGTRRLLPFRFGKPLGDMGTLWIKLVCLLKGGDGFRKLSLR